MFVTGNDKSKMEKLVAVRTRPGVDLRPDRQLAGNPTRGFMPDDHSSKAAYHDTSIRGFLVPGLALALSTDSLFS